MKKRFAKWLAAMLVAALLLTPIAVMEESIGTLPEATEETNQNTRGGYIPAEDEPVEDDPAPGANDEAAGNDAEPDAVILPEAVDEEAEGEISLDLPESVADGDTFDGLPEADGNSFTRIFAAGSLDEMSEPGGIPIDEEHFPDEAFRQYLLLNIDTDTLYDAENRPIGIPTLSDEEIENTTYIDISYWSDFGFDDGGTELKSLAGVECFTELIGLNCSYNALTKLDVSSLEHLELLLCGGNPLSLLNISGCAGLKKLDCADCGLTELDISGCDSLERLYCHDNKLKNLEISDRNDLIELYCQDNELTELDTNGCTALTELDCSYNWLTELTIGSNTSLDELYCENNQLTALNISGCAGLSVLNCSGNKLTTLAVSDCVNLMTLDCHNNPLTALDVTACARLAEVIRTYSPRYDYEYKAFVQSGGVDGVSCSIVYDRGMTLKPEFVKGEDIVRIDAEHFPDESFRNLILEQYDGNGDKILSSNEIRQIDTIDIEGEWVQNEQDFDGYWKGIGATSIRGIEYFTEITTLFVRNNRLTSVDLSRNTKLKYLFCSGNLLTELDISNCPELIKHITEENYRLWEDGIVRYESDEETYLQCDAGTRIILTKAPEPTPEPTPTPTPTISATRKNQKATVYVGTVYRLDLGGKTGKSFKSSKKKVAAVSKTGLVTPKKAGKARITFKVGKQKRTVTLTVKDPTIPKRVTLNLSGTVAAKKGESQALTVTLPEGTHSGIKWKSSNKKVATVSSTGMVKFKKKGKVTITATAVRGKKKAKVKFKVSN